MFKLNTKYEFQKQHRVKLIIDFFILLRTLMWKQLVSNCPKHYLTWFQKKLYTTEDEYEEIDMKEKTIKRQKQKIDGKGLTLIDQRDGDSHRRSSSRMRKRGLQKSPLGFGAWFQFVFWRKCDFHVTIIFYTLFFLTHLKKTRRNKKGWNRFL